MMKKPKYVLEPSTERRIAAREAARILDLSMGHLRSLARKEILRSWKIGPNTVLYSLDEIVAYGKEKAEGRRKGKIRGARPQGFSPDASGE
jgi:hypothetical protein